MACVASSPPPLAACPWSRAALRRRARRCPRHQVGALAALSPFVGSKLEAAERTHRELSLRLADPEGAGDTKKYQEVAKQLGALADVVARFGEYKALSSQLEEAKAMGKDDPDMAALVAEEVATLGGALEGLEVQLTQMLLPRDPLDEKNIMLEIRAGTGGEEAGLWCSDLLRMYTRYAEGQAGWKVQLMSTADMESGGAEGGDPADQRPGRVQQAQVGGGRAPRPAGARHRGGGAGAHQHRDGGGHAGAGRGGRPD